MKRALVLSGGGSKGAFEAGAIAYLLTEEKLDFHLFTGTSVGALNAAYLGQARNHQELQELAEDLKNTWLTIKGNQDIYRGGILGTFWRVLFRGALYNPTGLWNLINQKIDRERLFHRRTVVKIMVVSFETGKLCCVDSREPKYRQDFLAYVLASASMPFFFPAVPIAGEHWYDGGLRDLTPLSAAIKENPDEIIVITTFPLSPDLEVILPPAKPGSALQAVLRTVDILLNEISANDLQLAQAINKAWWRYPGKRPIPIRIIVPTKPLPGNALDFDPQKIRANFLAGYEAAQNPRALAMTRFPAPAGHSLQQPKPQISGKEAP
ncbi:MAG TPA: patatin-like phospholipase family protein [Capillibacterium sp.]